MQAELEPPTMTRRLVQPARQLGLLLALAVLPVVCLVGRVELELSEVRFAILEASGNITFVPVARPQPRNADDPRQP